MSMLDKTIYYVLECDSINCTVYDSFDCLEDAQNVVEEQEKLGNDNFYAISDNEFY